MKKVLFILLALALTFTAFAQVTVSGRVQARGSFLRTLDTDPNFKGGTNGSTSTSTYADGFAGAQNYLTTPDYVGKGTSFILGNDGSRINISGLLGDVSKKAVGFNIEFRPDIVWSTATSITSFTFATKTMNLWAQINPMVKLTFGTMGIGDYSINDATGNLFGNLDGVIRNLNWVDPGYRDSSNFGAFAQIMPVKELNVGVGVFSTTKYWWIPVDTTSAIPASTAASTTIRPVLAVKYSIPSFANIVVEGFVNVAQTNDDNALAYSKGSATFQYTGSKEFNAAIGYKYAGRKVINNDYSRYFGKQLDVATSGGAENSVMVLFNYMGVKNLSVAVGAEMALINPSLLTNASVGYQVTKTWKIALGTLGTTTFDAEKRQVSNVYSQGKKEQKGIIDVRVITLDARYTFPVASGWWGVGVGYDTAINAFFVPTYLRLNF